jgi:SAM-dependent methyltransferase
VDPDAESIRRANSRLRSVANARVLLTGFDRIDPDERRYDLITFVASLHHLPLRDTLQKVRQMLRPAGQLAVVGLSANKSVADWLWAGLSTPVARVGSLLHRETRDIGVAVTDPNEGLGEIRRAVTDVLPGARIRRGVYYRYRLLWRNA